MKKSLAGINQSASNVIYDNKSLEKLFLFLDNDDIQVSLFIYV